jgi:hypothetical protein
VKLLGSGFGRKGAFRGAQGGFVTWRDVDFKHTGARYSETALGLSSAELGGAEGSRVAEAHRSSAPPHQRSARRSGMAQCSQVNSTLSLDWPNMPYQCKCLDLKVLVKRCLPSLPTRLFQR